jgi:Fe2+ transport system protein FeoA
VEEVALRGPLLVRVGGARYAIGRRAAKILVRGETDPEPAGTANAGGR